MISALLNGDKDLKSCDKPYVHDEEYQEQQETPYFHASTTAREWRRENMGFLVFLIKKVQNRKWRFHHNFGVCKRRSKKHDPYYNLFFKPDGKCPRGEHIPYRVFVNTKHHPHTTDLRCRPHFGFQKQIYHISDIFLKWISTWCSALRIGIHRIVVYMYEIQQFFDETY